MLFFIYSLSRRLDTTFNIKVICTGFMGKPFFDLLNAEKRLARFEHHIRFISCCRERDLVPHGLQCFKSSSLEFARQHLSEEWSSTARDASIKFRDIQLRNFFYKVEDTRKDLENITNRIIDELGLAEYLRIRAEVSKLVTRYVAGFHGLEKKKLKKAVRASVVRR